MRAGRSSDVPAAQAVSHAIVAVDGSKFKAVNNPRQELHAATTGSADAKGRREYRALPQCAGTIDRTEPTEAEAKTVRLKEKLKKTSSGRWAGCAK